MNMQKLTQKSIEAIQKAQSIAIENQNAEILPEHIAYALIDDDGGLISNVVRKCGGNPDAVAAALDDKIRRMPKVGGSAHEPDKIYVSVSTDKVLVQAEKYATSAKDEYVSVEHIMLDI